MKGAAVRACAVAALAIAGTGTALAQTAHPIAARQEAMGELSSAHKTGSAMVKGRVPYDAQTAEAAMKAIAATAQKLPAMFPVGSENGEGTRASPAIWQSFTDFTGYLSRLQTTAIAAAAAAPQGLAAFMPAYDAVAATCKACHAAYRSHVAGEPDPMTTP